MIRHLVLALGALGFGQVSPAPERARDPWVFRCVLDKHPRMVVFALSKELWCAYDAQHCSFYAAWKGRAKLQGAVYDTVHGPQPVIDGVKYIDGFEEGNWEVYVGDKRVQADVRWGGYWFHDGRCTLLHEIFLPDGRHLQLRETPEYTRPELLFDDTQINDLVLFKGDTGLRRSFQLVNPADDVKICVRMRFAGVHGKLVELMEREDPDRGEGWIVLNAQKPLNNALLYWKPVPDAAPGAKQEEK